MLRADAAMTGAFGYLAASVSGVGFVKLSDAYDWQSVCLTFLVGSFLGGLFFMLTLRKPKQERSWHIRLYPKFFEKSFLHRFKSGVKG